MSFLDYLQNGMVVNIFYLCTRQALRQQLEKYLCVGTKSLRRIFITQKKEISVCEYKVLQVLTLLDCIRELENCPALQSCFLIKGCSFLDYLLEYCLKSCDMDCVRYKTLDFFTHFSKRSPWIAPYQHVRRVSQTEYRITLKDVFPNRFPETIIVRKNKNINSLVLLDFNKVYRVVGLYKQNGKYILTLFDYHALYDYYMIADFWLPKSCLKEIHGSVKPIKCLDNHVLVDRVILLISLNIWENQFIQLVDIQDKKPVIKSYLTKTLTQLKKKNK